jgi:hypothetical protein
VPCSEVLLKYCTNTVLKYILEDYAVDQFFSFRYVKLMCNVPGAAKSAMLQLCRSMPELTNVISQSNVLYKVNSYSNKQQPSASRAHAEQFLHYRNFAEFSGKLICHILFSA